MLNKTVDFFSGQGRRIPSRYGHGVCLAALIAAGCAHFEPQPLSPEKSARELESRSITNSSLQVFLEKSLGHPMDSWPMKDWDLDSLTLCAFYYNPALEVARAQWKVALGGETTAAQRPNPTLTLSPGYNTTTAIPSPWFPLTSLDFTVETAGKRKYRKARSQRLAEAARQKVVVTAWQVRSDVRLNLVALKVAQRRAELLEKLVSLQENIANVIKQQVEAGAISTADSFPYRLEWQRAKLDLTEARRLQVEARAKLATTMGVPFRALDAMQVHFDLEPGEDVLAQWSSSLARRTALQTRSDVLGALAEYDAAQSALQLEIAKQYPDLHLQPGYQFDQGDNKWSLGLLFELPVLNQNQGPIAEARAKREEAAAHFLEVQSKVMSELDAGVELLSLTRKNLEDLRVLAQTQAEREKSVLAQSQAGEVEPLDLLRAQFEAASGTLILLDGQLKLQQAIGTLENAVQQPLQFTGSALKSPNNHAR